MTAAEQAKLASVQAVSAALDAHTKVETEQANDQAAVAAAKATA